MKQRTLATQRVRFAKTFAQLYRECVSSHEHAQRKEAALTT